MSLIVLPHNLVTETVASSTSVQENDDAIVAVVNGNLTNENIAAGAAIALSKVAASYQRMVIALQWSATWPAAGVVMDAVPVFGTTGETAWTAEGIYWVCSDTGAGGRQFTVQWGYYNAAGVWTNAGSITTATTLANSALGANSPNQGVATLAGGGTVSFPDAQPRQLAIVATNGVEATTLDAVGSFLTVMVSLKRQITA
jgi:hypothetical protein